MLVRGRSGNQAASLFRQNDKDSVIQTVVHGLWSAKHS